MKKSSKFQRDADELFQQGSVQNYLQAELVAYLVSCNFDKESAVWAASSSPTLEGALELLQDDCELCMEKYPMNEMVSMLKCSHKCCKYCAKNYFTIQVRLLCSLRLKLYNNQISDHRAINWRLHMSILQDS